MSVQFAGINLRNRLVAASSPLTESLNRLACCRDAGFGAAILKSACPYTRGASDNYPRRVVYTPDGYYADSSFEREIMTLDEGLAGSKAWPRQRHAAGPKRDGQLNVT